MSDQKVTPRQQNGKQKLKLSDNLQIQFKNSSCTNERLVVNKLGMKFDPVCWKKNHEKGKIQFICIEPNCQAERRLACAHCIIDEHDEHVSNKITLEQYCDTFDVNYKQYLFQIAKLEEYYNNCKMSDVLRQIEKDCENLLEYISLQLKQLRDNYELEILQFAENQNQQLISLYNEEKYTLSKMKEYNTKNLFEMTPAEMDHSLLLLAPNHIQSIQIQLENFDDSTKNVSNIIKQQWNIINEQLIEGISDIVIQLSKNTLIEQSNNKETHSNQMQQTLYQQEESKIYQELQKYTQQQQQNYNTQQQQEFFSTSKKQQQENKNQPLQQSNSIPKQQFENKSQNNSSYKQQNSPKISEETKLFQQIKGISSQQLISPLKNTQQTAQFGLSNQKSLKQLVQINNTSIPKQINNNNTKTLKLASRQVSPNGQNYYCDIKGSNDQKKITNHQYSNSSQQTSFDRRVSAQRIQHQFTCNSNNMKCVHNDLPKAFPIFSCCNWAFPCYECHDMVSNHKAYIIVPSQRYCQHCQEIFTVNLMSTVDVKCYKCQ